MSDHFLVEEKLRIGMRWMKTRQEGYNTGLKVSELDKEEKMVEYQ